MKKMYKKLYYPIAGICILMSLVGIEKANAQNFNLVNKVTPIDRELGDLFATSVAVSGDYAIIGARKQNENVAGDDSIINAGAAYIYTKSSHGIWQESQKLVASDRDSTWEYFGVTVAISGNYAIVGAIQDGGDTIGSNGSNYMYRAGSAYVFERDTVTNIWQEKQKIVASDRDTSDSFGVSVAISGDYLVVGAYAADPMGNNLPVIDAGAAYVFEKEANSGEWIEKAKLVGTTMFLEDYFGRSVAIAGNYIAVGAIYDDWDENGGDSILDAGSVTIFKRSPSGGWGFDQKIVASDRDTSASFGVSLAMEGNTLLVSAPSDKFADTLRTDSMINAGAVYIFDYKNSLWTQTQKIVASDRAEDNIFGYSIGISDDRVLVGAHGNYFNNKGVDSIFNAGAAYLYEKDIATGTWSELEKVVSNHREEKGYFGVSAALSGSNAIVGASYEGFNASNLDSLADAGAAYFFEVCLVNGATVLLTNGIRASDTLATSYQWIDCGNNDTLIPGATNHTFYPVIDGNYAVIVQKNACLDTSACVNFTITGVSEEQGSNSVNIYPNPANEQLFIDLKNIKGTNLTLIDITGKEVYSSDITGKNKVSISLRDYDSGVYFVTITSKNEKLAYKLVVSH